MALKEWPSGTPHCTLAVGLCFQVLFGLSWPRRGLQEVTGLSLYYQLFPGAADDCARTFMICPVCDVV